MAKEALVVGITGIGGHNIAKELLSQGWKVHGLSRKPGNEIPGVNHVHGDVLDPASVSKAIEGLPITHMFFATWQRQATEAENVKVNGAMIKNTSTANTTT